MENLLLENKRKVCRTCLRIVDSRKKLISIFTSDPGIQNVKISFADMLTSITNEIVSMKIGLFLRNNNNCYLCDHSCLHSMNFLNGFAMSVSNKSDPPTNFE